MDIFFSISAGICASLGAVSSKFAFSEFSWEKQPIEFVLFLSLFLLFNVSMWIFFSRALATSTSTIKVMALNTGTNFTLTGILGGVLWGEAHSMLWWTGLSLVIVGSVLLLTEQQKIEEQKGKEKIR
ncbi:unnamed protein product, partial [Mesorhabditis belari]|uniref:EamA domain-containing protein n=1 Tax=Mesorhabditis belari TaxID=2138241 RepID=A0AAF3FIT7_9BILA